MTAKQSASLVDPISGSTRLGGGKSEIVKSALTETLPRDRLRWTGPACRHAVGGGRAERAVPVEHQHRTANGNAHGARVDDKVHDPPTTPAAQDRCCAAACTLGDGECYADEAPSAYSLRPFDVAVGIEMIAGVGD